MKTKNGTRSVSTTGAFFAIGHSERIAVIDLLTPLESADAIKRGLPMALRNSLV